MKPLSERLSAELVHANKMGDTDLADLLREAAELARRVEGAPSVEITACNQIEGARDFDYGDMAAAVQKFDAGQRVRLVPDDPTPPPPGHEREGRDG